MPKFYARKTRHEFDSARDAIDAVSAFEAASIEDWRYEIQPIAGHVDPRNWTWFATAQAVTDPARCFFLTPAA
jgi:hypothetical protein